MTESGYTTGTVPRDNPMEAAHALDRVPPVGRDDPRRDGSGRDRPDADTSDRRRSNRQAAAQPVSDHLELSEAARRLLRAPDAADTEAGASADTPAAPSTGGFEASG